MRGEVASEAKEGRFRATVTGWRYLTTPASKDRVVVEVEFDVSQGDWAYAPGDSIGIDCCNSREEVTGLLQRLGHETSRLVRVAALDKHDTPATPAAQQPSHARGAGAAGAPQHLVKKEPMTLGELVASSVDLRSQPKKALLRMLADHATVEAEVSPKPSTLNPGPQALNFCCVCSLIFRGQPLLPLSPLSLAPLACAGPIWRVSDIGFGW